MDGIQFEMESIYQEEITFQSAGAASEDILDDVIKQDKVLVVTYCGVENETNAYTDLRTGVKDGDVFTPLFQQDAPAAGIIYWMENVMLLREGQRICARITGGTASDFVKMRIQGYYYRVVKKES